MTQQLSNGSEPFAISVAIEVTQPFGKFYVAKFPAEKLLKVCFIEELAATKLADDEEYDLKGTQRGRSKPRLTEIAEFIETTEAAFPNAIILAANYSQDGILLAGNDDNDNEKYRWRVEKEDNNDCLKLVIPTDRELANIIDGQHRLKAFEQPTVKEDSKKMELLCAIYLDLPSAYQGYIFATINFNQKSVNKSLAYQLYGLTGNEEVDKNPDGWSPDRAAVALSKKLNLDKESPFYRRIIVSAQNEKLLFPEGTSGLDWRVSTATVVDGILKLFSKKPKSDRHKMFGHKTVRSRSILADDGTPLRKMYLQKNDLAIYEILKNYFIAIKQIFWEKAKPNSYIKKTVGIQAVFDVLNVILILYREKGKGKISIEAFADILYEASTIDFSEEYFQQASGIGRVQMREEILKKIEPKLEGIRSEDEN